MDNRYHTPLPGDAQRVSALELALDSLAAACREVTAAYADLHGRMSPVLVPQPAVPVGASGNSNNETSYSASPTVFTLHERTRQLLVLRDDIRNDIACLET